MAQSNIFANQLSSINNEKEFLKIYLQEVSANFSDYTEYPNFIGLDSACKMRWTGQWPQNANEMNQQAGACGATKGALIDEQQTDQQQIMSIEHQLHQQLQQQLCVEQFQLLSQLQVRPRLSSFLK